VIRDIIKAVFNGRLEYSEHALSQSIHRDISNQEVKQAIIGGKIIELPSPAVGESDHRLRAQPAGMDRLRSKAELRMTCHVCGGRLEDKLVTYTIEHGGQLHVFENVPARVCRQCGERYFADDTVGKVQGAIRQEREPDRFIQAPVIDYRSIV